MADKSKRSKSGEHEAVREYRDKLESIADGTMASVVDLNRELDACLEEVRSQPPPPQS